MKEETVIKLDGGDWRVEPLGESWRIIDAAGQVRGRFTDAKTMACHLAMAMAEVQVARDKNARLRHLLKPFAEYASERTQFADCVPLRLDFDAKPNDQLTLGHCRRALEGLK
jgi:hypothetical protein